MLVMHLSETPLVGAPLRLCRALRLHAGVEARLAVLKPYAHGYGKMRFSQDLEWEVHRDTIIDLVERCDVLHLHNFIDLDYQGFAPIELRRLWRQGKPMVRHFHSTPHAIARYMGCTVDDVFACPIPKLVIGQYPARFYPQARLVPNVVFAAAEAVSRGVDGPLRIGYAPSVFNSARQSRWDTKGYPETVKMLRTLQRRAHRAGVPLEIDIIEQVSHAECLRRKARCHLFVDDLVTGSYHLNTLEALVEGTATLCHIDGCVQGSLMELTGRSDFPALDVRLEDAAEVLLELARAPALVVALGQQSAAWMAEHWSPERMVGHFIAAYHEVMERPGQAFAPRFDALDDAARWRRVELPDLLWRQRHTRWPALPPQWYLRLRYRAGQLLRALGLHPHA